MLFIIIDVAETGDVVVLFKKIFASVETKQVK